MKKIMIAVTLLFGGGAERVVSVWASELSALGYDVSLLLYGRTEGEYPVAKGVQIHTVAESYRDYQQLGHIQRIRRMRAIIKKVKPDAVISFLPRMQIWMMLASLGIKTYRVETVRVSPWEICRKNPKEKKLWHMCLKRANAIIIQTAEQGEYFNEALKRKCVVIPNPVAEAYVENYKQSHSEQVREFAAVGRITPQKNYPMMLRAFQKAHAKHPHIRLSIFGVGDEAYLQSLYQLVHELGLDGIVEFKGRSDQISRELCSRDAFLMASDFEGLPNALIEAMASGLVCVSTDCRTGPKDLITNGENGFLIGVGDAEAMCGAICQIVEMPAARRHEMGAVARKTVLACCSQENSRNQLIRLIEKGLAK